MFTNKIISLNHFSLKKAAGFVLCFFCLFCLPLKTVVAGELKQDFLKISKEEGLQKAQVFLLQKINDGEIEAVHILAGILIKKKNIRGNLSLAVEVLEKGTELGDAKSSYLLGNYFSDGNYVKQDITKARYYYELADEIGHPKAKKALRNLPSVNVQELDNPSSAVENKPKQVKPAPQTAQKKPSEKYKNSLPPGFNPKQVTWRSDNLDINKVKTVGSGFSISTAGLIATNEHVINNCKKIFVIYQGKPKTAYLIAADKKADFAALDIKASTPAFFYFKGKNPELGEELISGGFPSPDNFGFGIKITTGVVSEEIYGNTSLFQHTTPTQPGNSGGPLLNNSAALVGISTAVSSVKWGEISAQNVNYAVANLTAKNLLSKWGLPYKTMDNTLIFDSKMLAKHLKKAAVQVLCY